MSGYLVLVAIDAGVWIGLSVAVGIGASLLPERWLQRDTALTRIRGWEDGGRVYRHRLRIHRWKDLLPESNGLGRGDRPSKSSIASRADVATLVVETRRAEYVHWTLAGCGLLFWAWNPPWLAVVMTLFGPAFNGPFIAVQRYNRARARRSVRPRRSHECPS